MAAVPVFNPGQKREVIMDYRQHDFWPEIKARADIRLVVRIIGGLVLLGVLATVVYYNNEAIGHFLSGLPHDTGL